MLVRLWRKGNPCALLVGIQTGTDTVKNHMEFPQKTKNGIAFDPAIPMLGIYPKNPDTPIRENVCTLMLIEALFTIAKSWKQRKCPSVDEWIKKLVHLHNGILLSRKKGIPTFCNSMDGTGDYYAKWNKPVGGRQIPYALTYKRNLMNKIN